RLWYARGVGALRGQPHLDRALEVGDSVSVAALGARGADAVEGAACDVAEPERLRHSEGFLPKGHCLLESRAEHRVARALREHARNRRARRTILDELLRLCERGSVLLRPAAVPARLGEKSGRLCGRLDVARGEEGVARQLERLDRHL